MNPSDVAPPPAIRCSVDVEHRSRSVVLRGKIIAIAATEGDYSLRIVKVSRSGSSNIEQAGTFRTRANEPLFVGMADVDAGPATHLIANFMVRANGQDVCRSGKEISDE